jgi:hypothetical protein
VIKSAAPPKRSSIAIYIGRNGPPRIIRSDAPTAPTPKPVYSSWADFIAKTSRAERLARCHAAAKKSNMQRLMSEAPQRHLKGHEVWSVIEAQRGRCFHCGWLAVESRPSKPNGAACAVAIGRPRARSRAVFVILAVIAAVVVVG